MNPTPRTIEAPGVPRRTFLKRLGAALLALAASPSATAADARRFDPAARARRLFEAAVARARKRASGPPLAPPAPLPATLRKLSYDEHRAIRFRPEKSIWRGEGRFFEAQLFHLGGFFHRPVAVRISGPDGERPVRFDPGQFTYPRGVRVGAEPGLGHAGVRFHAPFNRPDYADEFLVFLGASYFRAVGRGQAYGLSARCLAIDAGLPVPEEFPETIAFDLVTPAPGDRSVHVVAEVRSARAEAAFSFQATPGDETVLDVEGAVFLRSAVEAVGLAPLSSMFLFGEETPGRGGDFRPEVHDSDALVLWSATGERIVRPLRNPARTTVSAFRLDEPRGFGLVQRDRSFASYQDLEARYHLRPSAWIEPRGGFGRGAVRLLEIATQLESDDNVAAFFVPDAPGPELHPRYRITFGRDVPARGTGAQVVAFRSGVPGAGIAPATDGSRLFVVDWQGPVLQSLDDVAVRVDARGGMVASARAERNPEDGSWRTVFRVVPQGPDVELRAFLHRGEHALSETLSYLWQPALEPAR